MISAAVGDDHVLLVEAMVPMLRKSGIDVVVSAHEFGQLVASVRAYEPDVCVLDLRFGEHDHHDGVAAVQAASPRTRIVVLTADATIESMVAAVEAGAAAYVHKSRGCASLVTAIGKVMRGELVTDLPIRRHGRDSAGTDPEARLLARYLTVRERQCLELLVDGLRTDVMARRLGVSVTTVRSHVQALMTKLGVHSRLEAASFAVRHDLLGSPVTDGPAGAAERWAGGASLR
ncbi:response regulator transcription factor [Amycolatopsis granulosa]|uniref:response regulator transcription factor n=1 Tax=Amycolatopsis granulosa TaxID=185684 RepID=UPI001421099C|nr:response regulator transcription factor [Amycolatopsis granulosa]NIH83906.1 two-component system nitrate/nitrite response regulator NarL [Amycolatopsis granulosa]